MIWLDGENKKKLTIEEANVDLYYQKKKKKEEVKVTNIDFTSGKKKLVEAGIVSI